MTNLTLLDRVAGAWRRRRDGGAPAPSGSPPPCAEPAPAGDDLADRIAKVLERQPTVLAGRVNFIGLDKIRDHLGAGWPRLAERADRITRRAIERHLGDSDVYRPFGELQYLILFGDLAEEAGELKCAAISAEITERLLGMEAGSDLLLVRTAVKRVGGPLELRQICDAASIAAEFLAPPAEGAAPGPEDAAGAPPAPWGAAAPLVYQPIWDVRRDAVATFLCTQSPPASPIDPELLYRADMAVLARVLNDLRGLVVARRRLLLVARVHLETLARNRSRAEYVRLCQTLPPLPERLLVFNVVEETDEPPQARLLELLSYVKPYARTIMRQVPIARAKFLSARECGAATVATDVGAYAGNEAEAFDAMNRFVKAAGKSQLQTYVEGLNSISLASAAVASGFDYIAGSVIEPATEAIGDIYRFRIANLYQPREG